MEKLTITIDLGGTIVKTGILNGEVLLSSSTAGSSSKQGLMSTLPLIEKMVDDMLREKQIPMANVLGFGFSFPGLVDPDRHKILSTNKKYDDAIGVDLPKWANEKWKLPLYVENDARMALLGEWQHGAGKGYDNMVMVTLGTGIGTAVLVEGKPLKGRHYQAGNLGGHFTVDHRGTLCTCGNKGCMEAEASSWRLPELIRNHPAFYSSRMKEEKLLDYEALFRNASAKDPLAGEVLDHCFSVWSAGLITMIHAYDPEIIILGGGIMNSAEVILPELQRRIDQHAWTPWGRVKLVKARFIDSSALYGADFLVRSNRGEVTVDG